MKIIVTGSCGFVGERLCQKLRFNGHVVIEIDRKFGHEITHENVFEDIDSVDLIIHLAAKSFVPDSFNIPVQFYQTNILGTLNVLELARKTKAKVLYFSSYIYGIPNELPVSEKHKVSPHNPYAQSKLMSEGLCFAYYRDFGVHSIIFRPFNIYGKGQSDYFLIPSIFNQIDSGEVSLLDPDPKRDYVHVEDVTEAVIQTVKKDFSGCETYNIGTGISVSVRDLVNLIKEHCKTKFEVTYKNNARRNEVSDCYADIAKAKKELNWLPKININEGIKKIVKEYGYDK